MKGKTDQGIQAALGHNPRPTGKAKPRHLRRKARQDRADERQIVTDNRTPEQALAVLDKRLGKGVGAVKQRARLAHA